MKTIYDICIIGFGPAGIGLVNTLLNTDYSGKIICIEAGGKLTRKCSFIESGKCLSCKPCNVISGIGGCSVISSEKLSAYPAGSGLVDFFNSEQKAKDVLDHALDYLKTKIDLDIYPVDYDQLIQQNQHFQNNGLFFKFYDVYNFSHQQLISFYSNVVDRFLSDGHQLKINTEIANVIRNDEYFDIFTTAGDSYKANSVIFATGKYGNKFLSGYIDESISCQIDNSYDVGIRLEFPTSYSESFKNIHGDIKLKTQNARTYCFSIDGKVARYHLENKFFTEGYSKKGGATGLTNLSILFRINSDNPYYQSIKNNLLGNRVAKSVECTNLLQFLDSGSPFSNLLVDILGSDNVVYIRNITSKFINVLFPGRDLSLLNIYFPELDLIDTKIGYDTTFEVSKNLYIIGASTGIFRGILQAYSSGQQCAYEINKVNSPRYIFDALYGDFQIDSEIVPLLSTPEIQRLREVRLCNINSLSITGGSNINRYEHSLGTYHLAKICIEENNKHNLIDNEMASAFLKAALLHDIANGPFGHSYEYLASRQGYNPESGFAHAVRGSTDESGFEYKIISGETIFWGETRRVAKELNSNMIEIIGEMVDGNSLFGKILADKIDLDNIDNVYRMAYHMGINIDKSIPEKIARSIIISSNKITFKDEAVELLWNWHYVREKMYNLLLLNPDEFSGKCMLTEALDIARKDLNNTISWTDTDYELLLKLKEIHPQKEQIEFHDCTIPAPQNITLLSSSELLEYIDSYFDQNNQPNNGKHSLFKNGLVNSKVIYEDDNKIVLKKGKGSIRLYLTDNSIQIFKYVTVSLNASNIIQRLMNGKLYGCIGIYASSNCIPYKTFLDFNTRLQLEISISKALNNYLSVKYKNNKLPYFNIGLHAIIDCNKTRRQFTIELASGAVDTIGRRLDRLLVGIFIKNSNYSLQEMQIGRIDRSILNCIEKFVYNYIAKEIFNYKIRRIPLYGETTSLV